MLLLIINPGSTSTKVSLYRDDEEIFEESVFHDAPQLLSYKTVNDQVPFRKQLILDMLAQRGFRPADIDVYVGRGGSACTQESGVTVIDRLLYEHTRDAVGGSEHAAKLGVMIAYELCSEFGGKMYTMDPTNVDELCDLARFTGIEGVYRNAQSHTLNQKGVARLHAKNIGRSYEDCSFVVAHIDGGVTVAAHQNGRMIDCNVGSAGDGPFTPTRLGSVPVMAVLDYAEKHSIEEVRLMCWRKGGFVSFFGTANSDVVHKMAEEGDLKARLVWDAMIYQICKDIGAMSSVLCGRVDGILLTGGLCRFDDLVEKIKERCGWIAPVTVYQGEVEQQTLHDEVMKVIRGEAKARAYTGKNVWQGFPFDKQ